ncbi:hypothetical protein [Prevotella sp.]|uniref:hypothetical protein n=1 Tax=Prevotella sp. TaxID=59823 RepID=UPI0027E2EF7B|nr:hypothetical protein [Prevotella sp.]
MEEIEDVTIMEETGRCYNCGRNRKMLQLWKKPEDVTIVEAMMSWFILTEQVFV